MVEVWEELQAQVEQLTGQAGLRIIGAILENEVTRRVGQALGFCFLGCPMLGLWAL